MTALAQVAAAGATFPACVATTALLTEADLIRLAPLPRPKAERAAFFAPKLDWDERNEQLATALGRAQIALRVLDDHSAEVAHVAIGGEFPVIRLRHPPEPALLCRFTGIHRTSERDAQGLRPLACGLLSAEGCDALVEWRL